MEEISENEKRIRAITKLYYSNPAIQKAILDFCQNRETVPRYFEGFGKRPDTLTYPSDIIGLVNKGATSFHTSEEIWSDPLSLKTDMTQNEIKDLRKSWDLLIDIDSKFIDFSRIAAKLLLEELEKHGIKNYGIKFSGSKGFHIILSGKAFPNEFDGNLMKDSFPDWPRAICEYIMARIKPVFSREAHAISNIQALKIRTNKKEEELLRIVCPECGKSVVKDFWMTYRCPLCSNSVMIKKSVLSKKRVIRCGKCSGILNFEEEKEFFECPECKITNISKIGPANSPNIKYLSNVPFDNVQVMEKGLHEEETGGFDLILVAPRHLFRAPYSLHEKTSLSSVVLTKEELGNFSLKDADPLKVKIRNFMPENNPDEAQILLADALKWKKDHESNKEELDGKKYHSYEKLDIQGVDESLFPEPIKKLLNGLQDGKKRGLFILITFLRSLNFPPDYIIKKVGDWNKLNNPPLREGYIKSQLDWHLRQKKHILPPNYENQSFYKDIGLINKKQDAKNPISEVLRKLRRRNY